MKIFLIPALLFTALISAQKKDSLKIIPMAKVNPLQHKPMDSSIAKIYKMPVAKPKNPKLYPGLKAVTKTDSVLFKIPNLLKPNPPKKLAAK